MRQGARVLPEQQEFFRVVAEANPSLVDGGRVIEIGSYDVNGNIRAPFGPAREYVGVDLTEGPGVDRVGFGHEVDDPDGTYDLALSCDCFEHDPHWTDTLANMVRLTRPGGVVAATFASRGFPEHGTRRTDIDDSPGTQSIGVDYYRNLERGDFDALPLDEWFSTWRLWYVPTNFCMYLAGVRAGGDLGSTIDLDAEVARIRTLMPLPHRAVRWPLRIAGRVVGYGDRYQRVVLPYWLGMQRRFGNSGLAKRPGS